MDTPDMPFRKRIWADLKWSAKCKASRKNIPYFYALCETISYIIKISFQMLIGAAIVALIAGKILFRIVNMTSLFDIPPILRLNVLEIVGKGLAYSAGIELAYMLFTPGPDEALEPVILGLASAVLLIISNETVGWEDAIVVPIICLTIGFLFYIKRKFVPNTSS
jgi:hypothetical protein